MKLIFKLIFTFAALFALAYAVLFGQQLFREMTLPAFSGEGDAYVVLGAQIGPDGKPMLQLQYRLEAALNAYRKAPKPIVVTGARGKNEPRTEAAAMREWLMQNGVPETDILPDDQSFSTEDNLKNALRLLGGGKKQVVVVTSRYHLPRALAMARDMGIDARGIGSGILPEYWLKNHAREALAWGKYYLRKAMGAVGIGR